MPITEKDGDVEDYLYVDDAKGMLACVQMGTIEFHGWGSRIDPLEKPDRLVFDLDPDVGLDFAKVKEAAVRLRDLLADLGLVTFPLLSGGKGIHVVAPLDQTADWPAVKGFAERFSRAIAEAEPELFTANIRKDQRKGRIFLDWLRNQRGATAVMPYSARARDGAPVAAPVAWEELDGLTKRGDPSRSATPTCCSSAPARSCSPAGARRSRRCPTPRPSSGKRQRRGQAVGAPVALDRAVEVGLDAHRDHPLAKAAARRVGGSHGVPRLAPRPASIISPSIDQSRSMRPSSLHKRAIFDGVGVQLVEDHRQAEHLARLEQQFGPAEARPPGRDFGAEHALAQRRDGDVLPHLPDQQLVRAGERFRAGPRSSSVKLSMSARIGRGLQRDRLRPRSACSSPDARFPGGCAAGARPRCAALADVAHEADEQLVAELLARGDRQFDREFVAVAVERADLDPPVEHRAFAGLEIMTRPVFVRLAEGRRDDQVGQALAARFVPRPAEAVARCGRSSRSPCPSVSMTTTGSSAVSSTVCRPA